VGASQNCGARNVENPSGQLHSIRDRKVLPVAFCTAKKLDRGDHRVFHRIRRDNSLEPRL
jgi:hypothetical protein